MRLRQLVAHTLQISPAGESPRRSGGSELWMAVKRNEKFDSPGAKGLYPRRGFEE